MKMNAQYHGLTEAEARRLREMGGGNTPPPPITKSTGQIIRENVCTLFNLFNVLIAAALALVGAWSNLLFILIIALNTAIGIVQELHAKRLVEQIAVLTAPKARVLRDGEIWELPVEELVLGHPVNMDGTLGPRSEKAKAMKALLEEATSLPVVLWDERRTTIDAHNILFNSGKNARQRKKVVDAVAASLILEGYLTFKKSH